MIGIQVQVYISCDHHSISIKPLIKHHHINPSTIKKLQRSPHRSARTKLKDQEPIQKNKLNLTIQKSQSMNPTKHRNQRKTTHRLANSRKESGFQPNLFVSDTENQDLISQTTVNQLISSFLCPRIAKSRNRNNDLSR